VGELAQRCSLTVRILRFHDLPQTWAPPGDD
jgi:hypothetical protein